MTPYPEWLRILSWAYLSLSFACAAFISLDEIRRPQHMMIMNFVWLITALYLGPVAVWSYLTSGMKTTKQRHDEMHRKIQAELDAERQPGRAVAVPGDARSERPSREQVTVGVFHCGAGCTLGDIISEWWVFLAGLAFAGGIFQTRLFLDFLLAWGFGVIFQYFTIAPMRGLSLGKGLLAAIRVDTLAIVAFEIGLFGWMALMRFVLFRGSHLEPNDAVFWFMMQVGMIVGFFTSYPANRFLLAKGWKEKMPQYEAEMKRQMRRQLSHSHAV